MRSSRGQSVRAPRAGTAGQDLFPVREGQTRSDRSRDHPRNRSRPLWTWAGVGGIASAELEPE